MSAQSSRRLRLPRAARRQGPVLECSGPRPWAPHVRSPSSLSVRALAAGVAALALSLGATAADPDLGLAPLAPKASIEVDLPPPPPSLASERMRQLEGQINELIATNRHSFKVLKDGTLTVSKGPLDSANCPSVTFAR